MRANEYAPPNRFMCAVSEDLLRKTTSQAWIALASRQYSWIDGRCLIVERQIEECHVQPLST